MKVKVKKLHPNAVVPFKTHEEDFCYDLVAISREEIAPDVYKYGTGLAFEINKEVEIWDDGFKSVPLELNLCVTTKEKIFEPTRTYSEDLNLSLDIRPRSSIWKTGMILANSVGTIDEGYRGEVCLIFHHINKNLPKYQVGDKIGQLKIGLTLPINFVESSELNDTQRGVGGFGSTGK